MPQFSRGKIPAIYNVVQTGPNSGWWESGGGVNYMAWAITAGPTAIPLRKAPVSSPRAQGTKASDHPDQTFWVADTAKGRVLDEGITNVINKIGVKNILWIEIDCTLMPCNNGPDCCLYQVPKMIADFGLKGIELRIFSHRDEHMAQAGQSTKRMIKTKAGATKQDLDHAYKAHTDWSWAAAPWDGTYP